MTALQSVAEVEAQQVIASAVDAREMFPNGWTRTDNDVWDLDVSLKAKALFSVLQKFRDNETGYCWPSNETLAKMLSVSRRTAIRAVEELVQVGLVKKEARVREDGRQTSNGYWVAASVSSARSVMVCNSVTPGVTNLHTNYIHRTTTIQDFNSCSHVRNAREAETTENLNPKPEREESPSSVLEAPLRGGREEVSEWGVAVPAAPEDYFLGSDGEPLFPPGDPAWDFVPPPGYFDVPREPVPVVRPRDVFGPDWRGRMSTLRSDSPTGSQENRKEPASGGAWGDRVPLPSPKHVYGVGSDASEDHAMGSVGGVQGSPVPSPTPEVPERPRKPQWIYLQNAEKRWPDDGRPTTIPPTFTPSPRHVAFAEAWGLDVDLICKRFVAKHLAAGTLVQCWDMHFAELLEMKRCDKLKAEREAEALRPELEAAEAARQAKRREWSERLEAQKEGAVPPTKEFLALRPMMEELRAKHGGKPKLKGENFGWRADRNVGGESHGGPGAAVCEQRDPGVFIHPCLDAAPPESGDPDVGGRGNPVHPLRRVEADGGERRRVSGEGPQGGGDRQAVGADVRASGTAADVDQPDGGRDRPVPQVRDREAGEDDDGPIDVAAEFYAWRRLRDAQLAAG